MRARHTRSSMRKTKKTKNHFREANATPPKIAFKEVVATLSKKNEMGAYRSM